MMRSLYSGVAGLRTHQTKMDVLGNNIANVNTTSFKSQSITFSDLMYQTTQTASGATATKGGINARQIGLGAKSGAISTAIESQGATQTTNNPFDIQITGKAFFVVNDGSKQLYTRDGSFYVDGAGNLAMQSNGYLVQGWAAVEDPETGEIKVNKNGGLSGLQIMSADNSTYSPASTTAALYSGNIDDHDTNVTSDDGKTITLEFYDNKGYLYTGKFTLKDTGTDHLYALQLTDIIDSDGNSINKTVIDATGNTSKVMDHITFGSTQDSDPIESLDTHKVSIDPTTNTATVYLLAGATAYENVPLTGTLGDLMDSSKKAYKGLLAEAYGVSDTDVANAEYDKTAKYSIDKTTGTLTISYNLTDYTGNKNGTYGYTTTATSNYYYNTTTGIGYRKPSTSMKDAEYSSLSQYDLSTFTNVFGVTADANHVYTFDGSKLTVSAPCSLETATESKTTAAYLTALDSSFTASATSANPDLTTALAGYTNVYYTYDADKNLTVYPPKNQASGDNTSVDYTTLLTGKDYSGFTEGTLYDLTDLENMLLTAGYTPLEVLGIQGNLTNYASANMFKVTNLTGTPGIDLYNVTYTEVADTSNKLYEGSVTSTSYNPNSPYNTSTKLSSDISALYTNAGGGYDYVLTSSQTKVKDYSQNFLETVFGLSATDYTKYNNDSVQISTNGSNVTIYKAKTVTKDPVTTTVAPNYDSDSDTMYYTTTKNQAIKTISNEQMSGNIVDLMTTAEGDLKGLLNDVYGITDEDADAYGTDGKYEIDENGDITLTTGTHSIQLMFDAANGSLVDANGSSKGLVDIVFDQSIKGLEAFGYQKQPTDDDDVVLGRLTVDFSTVTNYNTSGSSTIKAVKGDKKSLNTGRAVGEMNGVNVSTDGQIFATYSNGQTKLLGQIASAEFANASGLSKEGDNLYSSTLNSGDPTVQDVTTDGGYMNTGVLEMSNVDLSREFTEMITTQRGFQANSRIITVSDTLLEELTNLKR